MKIRMKGSGMIFFISFIFLVNLRDAESVTKKLNFEEIREALVPLTKHCIGKIGLDPKLIADTEKGIFVPDRKLQCFFKCMMINTKVMKDDKIVEKALSKIAEHMLQEEIAQIVSKTMEHCHSVAMKKMDGCELAYEYLKCCFDFAQIRPL